MRYSPESLDIKIVIREYKPNAVTEVKILSNRPTKLS